MNNRGPTFLVVGVQKAGTTWLDNVLRNHPEIWMPPIKELHFFDDLQFTEQSGDAKRYFSSEIYIKNRWRRYLREELKRNIRFPSLSRAHWSARFLFGKRDFGWYTNLFPAGHECCGEVSPEYCYVDRGMIKRIQTEFPAIKIVLILRNPIERAWSHARMEMIWRKRKSSADVSEDELMAFIELKGVVGKSHYAKVIGNWFTEFPRDRVLVCLFDDIKDQPQQLSKEVFEFLQVDSDWRPSNDLLRNRAMQGIEHEMSSSTYGRLWELYRDDIRKVANLFPERNLEVKWKN